MMMVWNEKKYASLNISLQVEEELDSAKQRIRTKIEALTGYFSNIEQLKDFSLQIEQELSLAKKGIQTRVME